MESKAIVIGTDYGREKWIANVLRTLESVPYQVMALTQGRYELGKIRWVYEHTDLEEFLFVHDTMEFKRIDWLEEVFAYPFSVALTNKPCMFGMYLGKYQRKVLKHVPIPEVKTKEESVYYESHWTNEYFKVDPAAKVLWPGLDDQPMSEHRFVEVFDRPNLVLENECIIKYKGTWNLNQAQEIDRRESVIKI